MFEAIENAFRDLVASLQSAKLYGTEHRLFKNSVEKAYLSLQNALAEKEELVFGIIGEELAFGKEVFFDLSKIARPAIIYLKNRGIEKISFRLGLDKEELHKFISFLVTPKEEIKTTPAEYLSLMGVKNISVGKLKTSTENIPAQVEESINFLSLYESSIDRASQSLAGILNMESVDGLALRFAISNVMENIFGQYQDLLKLTTLKRYDAGTFEHILNVAILAMHFSSKMGFIKDDVLDIGIASLFHDIGKMYISRQLIRKADKLTEEEFARIRSHTIIGAELLLKYVDTLGVLPVVVAFEHHIKYNLKGYPKLSFPRKPHTASMIVSICDVYDALSERRGYKIDYSPDFVYNLMIKDKGESFEPRLLDRFFKIMGVWPIGSLVCLSDGRIAVVRDENEDNIFSPKVEVIDPPEKKEFLNLKDTQHSLKVQRYLNPWKEGKQYLGLIGAPPPKANSPSQ